jgi:hypothetical protein
MQPLDGMRFTTWVCLKMGYNILVYVHTHIYILYPFKSCLPSIYDIFGTKFGNMMNMIMARSGCVTHPWNHADNIKYSYLRPLKPRPSQVASTRAHICHVSSIFHAFNVSVWSGNVYVYFPDWN